MGIKDKLTTALSNPTSGIEMPKFKLEELPDDKVAGFVISGTFTDMSQIERQNLVWDFLETKLPPEILLKVSSLITVTPEEANEEKGEPSTEDDV